MRDFMHAQNKVVVKPLHSMGGRSIFVVDSADANANVVFETLTEHGTSFAMAQTYIPEITSGDKRILLVDGNPAPCALARVPAPDDNRGNLVAGAQPEVVDLSDRDRWICEQVGPVLKDRGIVFRGSRRHWRLPYRNQCHEPDRDSRIVETGRDRYGGRTHGPDRIPGRREPVPSLIALRDQ